MTSAIESPALSYESDRIESRPPPCSTRSCAWDFYLCLLVPEIYILHSKNVVLFHTYYLKNCTSCGFVFLLNAQGARQLRLHVGLPLSSISNSMLIWNSLNWVFKMQIWNILLFVSNIITNVTFPSISTLFGAFWWLLLIFFWWHIIDLFTNWFRKTLNNSKKEFSTRTVLLWSTEHLHRKKYKIKYIKFFLAVYQSHLAEF